MISQAEQLLRQQWKLFESTTILNGIDLADRLWAKKMYISMEASREALLAHHVGDYLNTGVSCWERIR